MSGFAVSSLITHQPSPFMDHTTNETLRKSIHIAVVFSRGAEMAALALCGRHRCWPLSPTG
jgi:hypothetical protein